MIWRDEAQWGTGVIGEEGREEGRGRGEEGKEERRGRRRGGEGGGEGGEEGKRRGGEEGEEGGEEGGGEGGGKESSCSKQCMCTMYMYIADGPNQKVNVHYNLNTKFTYDWTYMCIHCISIDVYMY